MARAHFDKIIKSLRGKIGGLVFRLMPDGSIVVSGAPIRKKKKGTPAQKEYWGTFADRAHWARWASKEYPIYAQLAAERPMVNAYNMAISDASHPPVIHRILREDGRILVQASDDVQVKLVMVGIQDENGKPLEWGDAIHLEGDMWEYAAKLEGRRIVAKAFDIPGNCTRMIME